MIPTISTSDSATTAAVPMAGALLAQLDTEHPVLATVAGREGLLERVLQGSGLRSVTMTGWWDAMS